MFQYLYIFLIFLILPSPSIPLPVSLALPPPRHVPYPERNEEFNIHVHREGEVEKDQRAAILTTLILALAVSSLLTVLQLMFPSLPLLQSCKAPSTLLSPPSQLRDRGTRSAVAAAGSRETVLR